MAGLPKNGLPKTGPVETYARMRAALDKAAFLAALPGPAVLIRLDERGGDDEPAPWAFHGSGLPLPVDVPSSEEDVVFVDRELTAQRPVALGADESTMTGPTFSLSIPAARGRATLHVLPAAAEVTLGRDAACAVRIKERSVSRRHARIAVDGGTFSVTHEAPQGASRPAIAVNGKVLPPGAAQGIGSGDVVDLADVSLLFLDAGELYDGLPRLTSG